VRRAGEGATTSRRPIRDLLRRAEAQPERDDALEVCALLAGDPLAHDQALRDLLALG